MYAKLFCKTGQLAGDDFLIKDQVTIGNTPDNNIVLNPKIVSGKHARIFYDENEKGYFLEDLGSRNGTQLDGVRVAEKQKLNKLHVITFAGMFDFIFQAFYDEGEPVEKAYTKKPAAKEETVFQKEEDFQVPVGIGEEQESTPSESKEEVDVHKTIYDNQEVPIPTIPIEKKSDSSEEPQEQEPQIAKTIADDQAIPIPNIEKEESKPEVPKRESTFILLVERSNKSFELKNGENTIGRAVDCDITIHDPSISRRHAVITLKFGKMTIRDLGSKNKTFVQNKIIEHEVEISPNTMIRVGEIEVIIIAN